MIKVVPFIQTAGIERFKQFLSVPFTFDMLAPISSKSSDVLFDDWRGKDMVNWQKYSNGEKVTLEVFAETYNICYKTRVFTLPHPETINEFINDMNRIGIQLYWTNWIDENFEPKEYLDKDEIKQYFVDLLGKLDKSHELQ